MSLERIIGFCPDNIQLYKQALRHRSSSVETDDGKWINNERLEFLGDAILDAVVADLLYKNFPNKREGFLTNLRSKIVQREMMDKIAQQLGLDEMVIYSSRMTINSHHGNHMYGNALEALIGAIYLDQGFDTCYAFIRDTMIKKHINIESLSRKEVNFKSNLIEWSQKNKLAITFDLIESFMDAEGNPVFQSAILLLGEQIGVGIGYSKKESQQAASKMAIHKIRNDKELQQRISEFKKKRATENAGETIETTDTPEMAETPNTPETNTNPNAENTAE